MSTIDPTRRSPIPRRSQNRGGRRAEDAAPASQATLPVPVEPPRPRPSGSAGAGRAALDAQIEGPRRGLRAGPDIHDIAASAYNSVEWSGSNDRRAPKGRAARTKI